jgi:putative hemolysin
MGAFHGKGVMFELAIIALCLILNGVLAASEIAFVAVNRPLLRELVRQNHKRARQLLRLRDNPERTLSVLQIGITLVGALAGAVGGAGAEELLSPSLEGSLGVSETTADTIAIGLVVLPLTYATVVIGELVPKSWALKDSLRFALRAAPWLCTFDTILGPIVTLFEWSTKQVLRVLRLVGLGPDTKALDQSGEEGTFGEGETIALDVLSVPHRQYVMNLVNLERKSLKDIYLPWKHVVHVDSTQPVEDIQAIILSSGHTRIPVMQGPAVLGILNTKEFMALHGAGRSNWSSLVRPPIRLQTSTALIAGLRLLQEKRMHMAVVYSAQALVGIVTLEDIVEEIIGEIYDEDDDGRLRRLLSAPAIIR